MLGGSKGNRVDAIEKINLPLEKALYEDILNSLEGKQNIIEALKQHRRLVKSTFSLAKVRDIGESLLMDSAVLESDEATKKLIVEQVNKVKKTRLKIFQNLFNDALNFSEMQNVKTLYNEKDNVGYLTINYPKNNPAMDKFLREIGFVESINFPNTNKENTLVLDPERVFKYQNDFIWYYPDDSPKKAFMESYKAAENVVKVQKKSEKVKGAEQAVGPPPQDPQNESPLNDQRQEFGNAFKEIALCQGTTVICPVKDGTSNNPGKQIRIIGALEKFKPILEKFKIKWEYPRDEQGKILTNPGFIIIKMENIASVLNNPEFIKAAEQSKNENEKRKKEENDKLEAIRKGIADIYTSYFPNEKPPSIEYSEWLGTDFLFIRPTTKGAVDSNLKKYIFENMSFRGTEEFHIEKTTLLEMIKDKKSIKAYLEEFRKKAEEVHVISTSKDIKNFIENVKNFAPEQTSKILKILDKEDLLDHVINDNKEIAKDIPPYIISSLFNIVKKEYMAQLKSAPRVPSEKDVDQIFQDMKNTLTRDANPPLTDARKREADNRYPSQVAQELLDSIKKPESPSNLKSWLKELQGSPSGYTQAFGKLYLVKLAELEIDKVKAKEETYKICKREVINSQSQEQFKKPQAPPLPPKPDKIKELNIDVEKDILPSPSQKAQDPMNGLFGKNIGKEYLERRSKTHNEQEGRPRKFLLSMKNINIFKNTRRQTQITQIETLFKFLNDAKNDRNEPIDPKIKAEVAYDMLKEMRKNLKKEWNIIGTGALDSLCEGYMKD